MTDLEITKLCAEAMGYGIGLSHSEQPIVYAYTRGAVDTFQYDPLHDDAQAMALVKRFICELRVITCPPHPDGFVWELKNLKTWDRVRGNDLNRAICECVAKMQLSRAGKNEKQTTCT